MGNTLGSMASCRADLFMIVTIVTLIAYIYYDSQQKKQHRQEVLKKMSNNVEMKMNEVYLKDNVDHLSIR